MGYYKRLELEGRRARKPSGGVDLQGLENLQRKLLRLQKFGKAGVDARVGALHKRFAHNISRQLKRRITDAREDITVWGRDKPLIVEQGTLRRSIGFWQPKGSRVDHLYLVGARTGKKVPASRDAWFQLIVEQDEQWVEGNNRNAGVMEKYYTEEMPEMRKKMLNEYVKLIQEMAKKA